MRIFLRYLSNLFIYLRNICPCFISFIFLSLFFFCCQFSFSAYLTRPESKCTTLQFYHYATGLDVTTIIYDDLDYLDVNMVRIEFICDIQSGGSINFSKYDYIIDELAKRNIGVLGLIDYQSLSTGGYSDWQTDAFRARYVARCQQIVAHFASRTNPVKHWEIWNEPDINVTGFVARIEPEPYGKILSESYTAIKDIDTSSVVLFGGISPKGFEYTENYLNDVYNSTGVQDYYTLHGSYPFDVVACHPYPEIFSNPNPSSGTGLDDVLNNLVKKTMNNHNDSKKKIWLTEMGWNSGTAVSENRQGTYLTSSFLLCDTLVDPANPANGPYVEKYFWFKYDSFGTTEEWGLVPQSRNRKKPSYFAFRNLTPNSPTPTPTPFDAGKDAPVWGASSDSALPEQVSGVDLLNGQTGSIMSGGFHSANVGTVADLTDGEFDTNPLTLVLQDAPGCTLRVRYTFSTPKDIEKIRVFSGHFSDSGNRAFISCDVYIDYALVKQELNSGNYGQITPVTTAAGKGAAVVRFDPETGEDYIAANVSTIEFAFYSVTATNFDFRDRFDPVSNPAQDTEGTGPAYMGSLLKEIDVFGKETISATPTPALTPTPSLTATPTPSPAISSTPTPFPTSSPSPTPSFTATPSPALTETPTPTPAVTPTPTFTPTPVITPTPLPSPTSSPTPTPMPIPNPNNFWFVF